MKLSEYLLQGKVLFKKVKLKKDIKLNNGEIRKRGDIVSLLMENENGTFHAEDNNWACRLTSDEFEVIWHKNKVIEKLRLYGVVV